MSAPFHRKGRSILGSIFRSIFAFFLIFAMSESAFADGEDDFDQANILYEQGEYEAAAAAYRAMLETGNASSAIHFNLGNSLYQIGKIGESLKSYHDALTLSPSDPDIRANIQFVRKRLGRLAVYPRGFLKEFLFQMTLNQWTLLALIPFWIWMISNICALFLRRSMALLLLKIISGMIFFLTATALIMAVRERWGKDYALISVPEAVVRFGPFEESKMGHTLPDGVEVLLLDHKDGWHQIRDPHGKIGWIPESQIINLPTRP